MRPGNAIPVLALLAVLCDAGPVLATLDNDAATAGPAAASADSLPDEALAATTERPWVPARPVRARSAAENVLGFPGRVISLPISAVGHVTKRTLITLEDNQFVPKVLYVVAVLPQVGLTLSPASLGDRTGFGIKAGVTPPRIRNILRAEWDGSTRKYSRTRAVATYGPIQAEYGYEWRPEDRFFGLGLSADDDTVTAYAAQTQQARLSLAGKRPIGSGPWRWEAGAWIGPRESITRHGRLSDDPSFEERFPELSPVLDRRIEHLVYGGRLELDSRQGSPHWSRGVRAGLELQRFDRPVRALAFRTTRSDVPFTRAVVEAEGGFSFYRDPRTVRLLVRAVDQSGGALDAYIDGGAYPRMQLADLAGLGGSRGLAGFEPGRFHGFDAAVARLSYIFPIATRFEFDVHAEAGGVYGDLWEEARLSSLKHSYGVALRPRLDQAVLGSVGVDWSNEAVRFRFSVGGVE